MDMGSKFFSAVKCFFKCPACTMTALLSPDSLGDPRFRELLKERCPEIDVDSLGFYAGFFLAFLFVVFCMIAYILFGVLRLLIQSPPA
jgi:hypothetical protein